MSLPTPTMRATAAQAWTATAHLAERFRLILYDAVYLELAQRLGLPQFAAVVSSKPCAQRSVLGLGSVLDGFFQVADILLHFAFDLFLQTLLRHDHQRACLDARHNANPNRWAEGHTPGARCG
jgi:hypothetical protein